MQNELSSIQNQESFTDLTLDGAQVSPTSAGGKSITPDARLALNEKKNQIIHVYSLENLKCSLQVTSNPKK